MKKMNAIEMRNTNGGWKCQCAICGKKFNVYGLITGWVFAGHVAKCKG